ncbi:hypothetical protein J5N97_009116 [Dioscorea zingiberensis]|uniref:F-box domain-containing protein n=1 Tax=Dioscorea zingiberensis TaxID=325984 RepID=A0A9D5CWK5_9LILI|nr:hypothetical protein J5N97_009116 [Dioscorea zingiberensis]
MAETCNPRRLPWLMKSCIPDPRRETAKLPSGNRHPSAVDATVAAVASPSISSLPDDLLLEILSRVPHPSIPSLSLVCRRFTFLLDSPAFFALRRSHGLLRPALHALSLPSPSDLCPASLCLLSFAWDLPFGPIPIPAEIPDGSLAHARAVTLGRSIYLIGRGATLRFDAWTGAVSSRSPTLFPRKKFAAAAIAGRIYVAGGAARTSAVEEYDPDLDAWRVVGDVPRRRYGCVGAAAAGVFYVIGGLIVGRGVEDSARAGRLDAHVWAGTMDTYEVETGSWGRGRAAAVPGGGCVVGACGAGSHVYVLASHAVEVSFWRWEAGKGRRGDWARLEPPPVSGHLGLGGAARFCCSALGEDKIVALVHVSSDAARRRGSAEGFVLVYDIASGEWNRGPDLPTGFRRASLACVEC